MHPFPKTDLAKLMRYRGEIRALALLAALRFVSETDLVRAGVDSDTLTRLAASDLVFRLPIQRTLTSARAATVFALRRAGALTLARTLDVEATSVHSDTLSSCRRSIMFLDHTLARSRFAILLASALSASVRGLREWRQDEADIEIAKWSASLDRVGKSTQLIPDAVATIATPDERQETLVIEIDRGTERPSYMAAKYEAYADAWRLGLLSKCFGTGAVRIVTITPGVRRLERLMDAARGAVSTAGGSGLFWFAVDDELATNGMLAPVWRTMKSNAAALWKT